MRSAVTLIIASWLLSVAVQSQTTKRCFGKAADIMFVLDSSTSIWSEDFKRQLKFVRNLVNSFDIGTGESQVRVGVITFSDDAHLEFSFDKHTSRNELEDAILAIPYRSGITNTAAALRMARLQLGRYLYDSSGLFVTIVITDGLSQLPHETEREAKNLHTLGVHVYAIGVGKHYDVEELKVIASDPLHNVFEVSSYAVLENIAQSFNVKTCEEKTPPSRPSITTPTESTTTATTTTTTRAKATTTTTTTTALPTTIATEDLLPRDEASSVSYGFDLLSLGAYRAQKIHQFISTLLPYTIYGHYGVVSYAFCPTSLNQPITSVMNETEDYIAYNGTEQGLPNLVDVLRQMRNNLNAQSLHNAQNGRTGSQVGVLFLDPSLTAITTDLKEEAEKLKQDGAKLFLVTIGRNSWSYPDRLYSLSSQPYMNYMYRAMTYDQLLYRARYSPYQFRTMCNPYIPTYLG